ncbi:MAG TPA: DUF2207 domain-containing protein [Propionibacteriaceae bacterium]
MTRSLHRLVRLLLGLVLALAGVVGAAALTAAPAYAADDQIDSFDITYAMQPDGVLKVTEKIDWRFGSNSGRHGIKRNFVVREPYDQTQDAVYTISNISVQTTGGVSNTFSSSTSEEQSGREETLELKIGDPDETISAPTASYTISYDVAGAMRSFPNKSPAYDEFYWDALGTGFPLIKDASVTATVPGGAQDVSCFAGPPQSKTECTGKDFTPDGKATFSQDSLPATQGMTIGVKIKPGLVSPNTPDLQPDGSKLTAAEKLGTIVIAAVGGIVLIGSPLAGVFWWRKNGRDKRYAGLAPGTTPLAGQAAHVVPNDPDLPIPVAFSPPRIPVAEAGLLIDGQVDARETAATIIDLAVRGALTVQSTDKDDFQVTLVDPSKAAAPHEMVLLTALFDGQPPGATKDLSARGSMLAAHKEMQTSVRNQVAARGWFRKVPSATATGSFGVGAIALVVFAAFGIGWAVLWVLVPLAPIIITVAVIRSKLKRGQRTADGRAVCDQVEGFKTYLSTAEADQLKFEEGEDIFSKYLPWAIVFELADRWAKICGDLVAAGRIPNETPYWYYGSYNMTAFNTGFLTSSLTTAATPAASSGSSGTGFGGGSSFGGGGFSGGGGGGGGGSSW